MKDNISDFPGYYVTVDGKVYSRKNNRHGYLKDYHLLKTKYTKHDGRPYVTLRNPKLGIRRLAKVHRLVALAYIPNPENKPCVCHKDNNPLNNHYKNRYWGTHQENMAQMIVDGRKQKGEECPRWVNKEIPELFDYYCDGVSTMELAEMFNTNKSMINKIIRYKFKELWQGRK